MKAAKDFASTGHSGAYARELDFIILRPEGELSSVLAHELSHRAQNIESRLPRCARCAANFRPSTSSARC